MVELHPDLEARLDRIEKAIQELAEAFLDTPDAKEVLRKLRGEASEAPSDKL